MCARWTYIPLGKSASASFKEFSEGMGRVDTQFFRRMDFGALQQATYALGLSDNMAIINDITTYLKSQGKEFSNAKFNFWRMAEGQDLWGEAARLEGLKLAKEGRFTK